MDDTRQARVRWFRFKPRYFVIAMLAVGVLLGRAEQFCRFPKGWPILMLFVAVGAMILVMFVWFVVLK